MDRHPIIRTEAILVPSFGHTSAAHCWGLGAHRASGGSVTSFSLRNTGVLCCVVCEICFRTTNAYVKSVTDESHCGQDNVLGICVDHSVVM